MHTEESRPFLTIQDVADRWQVDKRTVRREIDSGALPKHRLADRAVRIALNDLLLYEAKRGKLMSSKVTQSRSKNNKKK